MNITATLIIRVGSVAGSPGNFSGRYLSLVDGRQVIASEAMLRTLAARPQVWEGDFWVEGAGEPGVDDGARVVRRDLIRNLYPSATWIMSKAKEADANAIPR